MDKTERLLDLVALLLSAREPVPFAELRALFPDDYGGPSRESAERKLERDKAELTALGVPLEFVAPDDDRELGGYRIDRNAFFLPDPKLLPEESAALYAAGAAALSGRDFPFSQDLAHALRKIALAGSGRGPAASGRDALAEMPGAGSAARRLLIVRPGDPARAGKLRVLGDAVARRKRVHIVYLSAPAVGDATGGERTERDVDPYGLAFSGGAWRLVAHCHLRTAQRVFVVDRIESLAVSEQKPNQADFEIPAAFDAGEVARRRPWQWAGSASIPTSLRFAAGSELLAERVFDATATPLIDGGARALVETTWVEGLLPAVLELGDRVWIEGPPSARARAQSCLEKLAKLLAQDATDAVALVAEAPVPTRPELAIKDSRREGSAPGRKLAKSRPDLEAVAPDKRERLRRLLLIVPAALKRPGIRVEELARQLSLDPTELTADIDLLSVVGRPPFSPDDLIDISVDERGRVTVTLDQSFSAPPQLTAFEALALSAAAQEAAPADPAVMAALAKLTESLPGPAQKLFSAIAHRVATAPAPRGTEGILARLRAAAEAHQEVILGYDKEGRGQLEERTLEPQGVIDHGGRWYVFGRDAGKDAERTFRIDRVHEVRSTGRAFPDPGPLDAEKFQRPELFFPSGAETAVSIRFSPSAAAWALSRWGSRARKLAGGAVEISIESASSAYAVQLVLSFAGEAEIVAPPPARAALREAVERALARY
jgi:predicted DNA-binding transcriptional regulator YafY